MNPQQEATALVRDYIDSDEFTCSRVMNLLNRWQKFKGADYAKRNNISFEDAVVDGFSIEIREYVGSLIVSSNVFSLARSLALISYKYVDWTSVAKHYIDKR